MQWTREYKHFDDKHWKAQRKISCTVQCLPARTPLHSTPLHSCDAISPAYTHWMACIGWWCDFVFTVFDALYFHQNTREQRFRGNVNIISLPHDRNNSAITLTVLNWFLFGECMRFNLYGDSCVFFLFSCTNATMILLLFGTSSEATEYAITLQCNSPSFFYQQ